MAMHSGAVQGTPWLRAIWRERAFLPLKDLEQEEHLWGRITSEVAMSSTCVVLSLSGVDVVASSFNDSEFELETLIWRIFIREDRIVLSGVGGPDFASSSSPSSEFDVGRNVLVFLGGGSLERIVENLVFCVSYSYKYAN